MVQAKATGTEGPTSRGLLAWGLGLLSSTLGGLVGDDAGPAARVCERCGARARQGTLCGVLFRTTTPPTGTDVRLMVIPVSVAVGKTAPLCLACARALLSEAGVEPESVEVLR